MFRHTYICLAMLVLLAGIRAGKAVAQESQKPVPATRQNDQPSTVPGGDGYSRKPLQRAPDADVRAHRVKQFEDQARALLKAGKLAGAEQACRQALAIAEQGSSIPYGFGRQLLGEIYLQGRQNTRALECFRASGHNPANTRLNLDIALTYCQLGDYEHARPFYSDNDVLQYTFGSHPADASNLPCTDNLNALKASVLMARGVNACFVEDHDEAIVNLQAADKLVPKNPMVHYYWASALMHATRYAECLPHFQIAAARGVGELGKFAQEEGREVQNQLANMKLWQAQQAKNRRIRKRLPPQAVNVLL